MNRSAPAENGIGQEKPGKIVTPLLIFVAALGLFLRLWGLESQSLDNDELSSWHRSSYDSVSEVLEKGVLSEAHPPGYHLLLHGVQALFGDGEAALRLPSVIFGLVAILATFWIGWRLAGNEVALLAAALMAVMESPLRVSQEARMYAGLLAWCSLAFATFLELRRLAEAPRQQRRPYLLLFWITCLASVYFHYYGLVFVGWLFVISCFVFRKKLLPNLTVFFLPVAILFLPWVPAMLSQPKGGTDWIGDSFYHAGWEFMRAGCNRYGGLLILLMVLYLWPVWRRWFWPTEWKKKPLGYRREEGLLALMLFGPMLLMLAASIAVRPMLHQRYLVICLPFLYLLAALAFSRLPLRAPGRHALSAAFVLAMLADLVFVKGYYTHAHREQFREAARLVTENEKRPQDIPVLACAWDKAYFDYYFRRFGSPLRVNGLVCNRQQWERLRTKADLSGTRRVWFLRGHREIDPGLPEQMSRDLGLPLRHQAFFKADAWVLGGDG